MNVSSFFDTSSDKNPFAPPPLTTSLSFDSIQLREEEEAVDFSNLRGNENVVLPIRENGRISPAVSAAGDQEDDDDEEEIRHIRAANLMQRTLYIELEKLKNTDTEPETGQDGPVRSDDNSELLVNGELRSKVASQVNTIVNDKFSSWEDDFSQYLERRRSLVGEEESNEEATGSSEDLDYNAEKRSSQGGFLFSNVDWGDSSYTEKDLYTIPESPVSKTTPSPHGRSHRRTIPAPVAPKESPISRSNSDVRKAFTEFHNNTTENASPFLGEDNSSHNGKTFSSDMFTSYQQNLDKNFRAANVEPVLANQSTTSECKEGEVQNSETRNREVTESLKRSNNCQSGLAARGNAAHVTHKPADFASPFSSAAPSSLQPCLLPMPGGRAFLEGKNSRRVPDLSKLLLSIPLDAWITPYIITASVLLSERKLPDKSLTDISFQQDPARINPCGNRSRSNSDLGTVEEDIAEDGRKSPQWGTFVGIEENVELEDDSSKSHLTNPFKYLNPFRHKSKNKSRNDDKDELDESGRDMWESQSLDDVNDYAEMRRTHSSNRVDSHNGIAGVGGTPHQGHHQKFKSSHKLGLGQRNSESCYSDSNAQGELLYGDLIVSHDENGVYLSSHPSDSNLTGQGLATSMSSSQLAGSNSCKTSLSSSPESGMSGAAFRSGDGNWSSDANPVPQFLQSLFRHPNCTDLGEIYFCRDYNQSSDEVNNIWEERRCYLWDNYVFELSPEFEDSRPIGFVNLSGAVLTKENASATNASTALVTGSLLRKKFAEKKGLFSPPIVISLRFFVSSSPTAQRKSISLCGSSSKETQKLLEHLQAANRCDVRSLYDYDEINETKPDLGTGRYSKCFKAVNKRIRRRALGDEECSDDDSSRVSCSDNDSRSCGLDLDDDDDAQRDVRRIDAVKEALKGAFRKNKKKGRKKKKKKRKNKPSVKLEYEDEGPDAETCSTVDEHGNFIHDGQCALKLVDKTAYWERVRKGKERGDSLSREILAQAHLLSTVVNAANSPLSDDETKHFELPIVQLYGILETREYFAIEMELMQNQDLSEKLNECGEFSEEQAKHIAIQLVQAVALCQVNGMVHRDIKLTNITFPVRTNAALQPAESSSSSSAATAPLQIKLADFGMAGFIEKDGKLRGRCGTPGYVAPEILKAGKREGYGMGVDMFSVGCVVYTLLCGYEPFFGETEQELIENNKSCDYTFPYQEWGKISDEAKDFVDKLLNPFPSRRMTVHEALDHPWMAPYGGIINYPPKFISNHHSTCIIS